MLNIVKIRISVRCAAPIGPLAYKKSMAAAAQD
jgi:hypothetical protein